MATAAVRAAVRRAARAVVGFQLASWLLIGAFGFGVSPLTDVLGATQFPGIVLLTQLGWCCGIGGGFVISDLVTNRWGGLSLHGAPVLFVANALVLLAVALPAAAAWARLRRREAAV